MADMLVSVLSPGDALLRPQLLKMLPFTLSRLTITLQPSLEKFESQLLQLINADCQNTVRPGFCNVRTHTHTDSMVHAHSPLSKVPEFAMRGQQSHLNIF